MKKLTKKVISFALAVVLILSTFAFSATAADVAIAVSLDKSSCMQGDTFVATIYFPAKFDKAAALDLELTYDQARVEFVKMEKGVGLNNALNAQLNGKVYSENAATPGKICWVLAGSNNFEFTGVFATVTFKVRDRATHGANDITLTVTNAANSGYVDITSQVVTRSASVEILRNISNDFEFQFDAAKNGYIVKAYRASGVSELVIPSYYDDYPVIGIADKVFYNRGEIVSVDLPSELLYIGNEAFSNCRSLTSVEIPNTVETIGESAFLNCQSLETVSLPLGLKEIQPNTFYACYKLNNVEIPFTVEKIGINAFFNCLSLTAVKISKNTAEIGNNAFAQGNFNGIEFTTVESNTYLAEHIADKYPKSRIKVVEDISLGEVSAIQERVEYTGAPIEPEVTVTLENDVAVAEGTDYKVVYVANTKAGNAKVYVVGIEGYGEGYVLDFEIFCHHDSVKKVVTQKAKCTVDGVYRCTCNHCGYVFTETIPAQGHPAGQWVYDVRPTYKATGKKHRVCTVCGVSYDLNTVAEKVFPDVDLNTRINSNDALLILQTAVGKNVYVTPQGLFNADANGDTKINSSDALIVLQISVGIITL